MTKLERILVSPEQKRYLFQTVLLEHEDGNTFTLEVDGVLAVVIITQSELAANPQVLAFFKNLLEQMPEELRTKLDTPLSDFPIATKPRNAIVRVFGKDATVRDLLKYAQRPNADSTLKVIPNFGDNGLLQVVKALVVYYAVDPSELSTSLDLYTIQLIDEAKLLNTGFDHARIEAAKTILYRPKKTSMIRPRFKEKHE